MKVLLDALVDTYEGRFDLGPWYWLIVVVTGNSVYSEHGRVMLPLLLPTAAFVSRWLIAVQWMYR